MSGLIMLVMLILYSAIVESDACTSTERRRSNRLETNYWAKGHRSDKQRRAFMQRDATAVTRPGGNGFAIMQPFAKVDARSLSAFLLGSRKPYLDQPGSRTGSLQQMKGQIIDHGTIFTVLPTSIESRPESES
jgi:hypothetical protein